jgi:hypothetical protein
MDDSDAIRDLVDRRMVELGLDRTVVSRQIGKGRGYLHDYIVRRSPRLLPDEVVPLLAPILKLPVGALIGVSATSARPPTGMAEDAEPYHVRPGSIIPPPNIELLRLVSRKLDQHPLGLAPGKVLGFNKNLADPGQIPAGAVVFATAFDLAGNALERGPIVRQFLPPGKLVTNSSLGDEIVPLQSAKRDFVLKIGGSMTFVIDEVPGGQNRIFPSEMIAPEDTQHLP